MQADLCALPDLGAPFDAVVASMVLPAVPDWTGAMHACVRALKPRGLIRLGYQLTEVAEPGLAPEAAADGPEGIEAYVHLPNFLIVAARRAA